MGKFSFAYRTYLGINKVLSRFERLNVKSDFSTKTPPIFILGAPRSGTTLFYQSLVLEFDFAYLSNLHCKLFGAPYLAEKISDYRSKYQQNPTFKSRFGSTKNWFSPSECGEYWYRFFRRSPQFVSLADAEGQELINLKTSYYALQNAANKPVVFKNLLSVLRLEPILEVFPDALFLYVRRNEVENAHSILAARKALYNDYDKWFSLQPPSVSKISLLSPEKQAVEQIREVHSLIKKSLKGKEKQLFELDYEAFCNNPELIMDNVSSFLSQNGFRHSRSSTIKEPFKKSSKITIDKELYSNLVQYIQNNPMKTP
ncbi:MAG: sulfotransferase [Balneola sp.]|nr:sulfotransferase [Balneola sp.]MBO6801084.1 sulfotransferase [Balneola sp.]MBO6871276.1 sulfotransferase [Balneola sp.]